MLCDMIMVMDTEGYTTVVRDLANPKPKELCPLSCPPSGLSSRYRHPHISLAIAATITSGTPRTTLNQTLLRSACRKLSMALRLIIEPSSSPMNGSRRGSPLAKKNALARRPSKRSVNSLWRPSMGCQFSSSVKDEIFCSFPQVGSDGSTLIAFCKSVSCSYFQVIVIDIICSAPHKSLGIHVKVGNLGEGECPHFICKDCLSHWHRQVTSKLAQSDCSSSGTNPVVHCFHDDCKALVGNLLSLEAIIRANGLSRPRSVVATVDVVKIAAPAIIDPDSVIEWASIYPDFNFGAHVLSLQSNPAPRNIENRG